MSNFTGVTFAQQKVLPSDDAIIRRAILPDGILYGCELSYSGSTLTMTAGQMILCGRQIRHPSSQNWAVVDATSGYARLLLTVDLTRTSTKEVFEQVVDSIEYASAEDGFSELEQTDVNVSGSRYQAVACVVSLGAGGITGIVSQLQQSRVEGGGGLNFSVVGGLTQPSDPKENMIWVPTDVDITSWIFSAAEPTEPVEGMVWITTGATSAASFNALKKNGITVYPISAKQYIGGALVYKTAKSYQGGKWADWWDGHLYNAGNEFNAITGGWEAYTDQAKLTKNASNLSLVCASDPGNNYGYVAGTVKKIDLTNVSKIFAIVSGPISSYTSVYTVSVFTNKTDRTSRVAYVSVCGTNSSQIQIDVSSLTGEYYIGITSGTVGGNPTVLYKCWLE